MLYPDVASYSWESEDARSGKHRQEKDESVSDYRLVFKTQDHTKHAQIALVPGRLHVPIIYAYYICMYSKHDELISMGYDYFPRVERTEAHGFQDHVEKDNFLVCVTHLAHDVIDIAKMYT